MASISDRRVKELTLMALMLRKLDKLYPEFASEVTWIRAHELLADWLIPQELRENVLADRLLDHFFLCHVSQFAGIPMIDVIEGFLIASQSQESQPQLS
jgi:hypothetical protein